MPSTWSAYKFELLQDGTTNWGTPTNDNIGIAIQQAIGGKTSVTVTSGTNVLSLSNTSALQNARAFFIELIGTPGTGYAVELPAIEKPYVIYNNVTGGFIATVSVSGGTSVSVPGGAAMLLYAAGALGVRDIISHLNSLTLATPLPVSSGGTGANTAGNARTNLGATTVGANFFTLTNPSAIRYPQINADNSVSSIDAVTLRTNIGAGTVAQVTGSGTVQGITLSGNVTSTGSLTLSGSLSAVDLTSQVSNILPIANGGTGANTAGNARTNLGATTVGANFFTLTNPSAIRYPQINADNSVSSIDAVTLRTNIGATTVGANFFTLTNPSAIRYPQINADNSVSSIDAVTLRTNIGAGTVAQVTGSGTVQGITLSGNVTSTGSLTLSGSLSAVNLTSQVSNTLPIANGGTNTTTTPTAGGVAYGTGTAYAFTAAGTLGYVLTSNGSGAPTWAAPASTGVTTISFGSTGLTPSSPTSSAVTVAGILNVGSGGTGITAGVQGGVLYFSGTTTVASSASLTLNNLVIGGGTGAPTTATTGTGVLTALGTNTGTAGAFVVNGGALGTPSSGTLSNATVDGTNKVGFREVPQNSQSSSYTLVLSDSGKHIYHSAGSPAAVYTIPSDSSVSFVIGTVITFINLATTTVTITPVDTLIWAGSGSTGSRVLAQYGSASILKLTSTQWIITGVGLT